ncbi:MAG TPA: cytochrome c [Terracidiphilus sp.]|nr:cytochrome c [Terracidiphilus sp.]
MRRSGIRVFAGLVMLAVSVLMMAAGSHWMGKVPEQERSRVNPYAEKPEAARAGHLLFEDHCAKCHGEDALGRHGRPSLRGEEVRGATDGELAWLLKNGSLWKGMPSWSVLPEQQRWQIIAYLRSLPPNPRPGGEAQR